MSKVNDGGPAFPVVVPTDFQFAEDGMTLRDWFAGQALTGLLAHQQEDGSGFLHELGPGAAAHQAYRFADAMLRARQSQEGDNE